MRSVVPRVLRPTCFRPGPHALRNGNSGSVVPGGLLLPERRILASIAMAFERAREQPCTVALPTLYGLPTRRVSGLFRVPPRVNDERDTDKAGTQGNRGAVGRGRAARRGAFFSARGGASPTRQAHHCLCGSRLPRACRRACLFTAAYLYRGCFVCSARLQHRQRKRGGV